MRHPVIAAAAAAAGLLASAASAAAAPPADVTAAVTRGANWLRAQQDPATGTLPGFGGDWALSALAAAGVHPADVRAGGPSAQDAYLAEWTNADWSDGTGLRAADYARAVMLATASGLQPTRLSARSNLVARLAGLGQANGAFGAPEDLNATVFGVLALSRTRVPAAALRRATAFIRAGVHDDGGWNWTPATTPAEKATPGDVDMTGAALAALCAAGATTSDPDVAAGLAFLRGKLDDATGAFDALFGANADSNAWAIAGLNACGVDPQSPAWTTAQGKTPIDYLLSLQRPDGAFQYTPSDPTPSLFSTQGAVRALAGEDFGAAPPAGRVRAGATVADGTPVPTVLVLDDGKGDVRLCRTTAPAGAPVSAVLQAARAAASPAGCVSELTAQDGLVTSVNGARPDAARGGWLASLDGGREASAAGQHVGFGDILALRLEHSALPAGTLSGAATDFGAQTVGTLGPAQSVTFTAGGAYPVHPTRAITTGDDFLIASDGCAETTLAPGRSCTVRVRFAPSAAGARTGTVRLLGDAPASATVSGTGTSVILAPVAGVPGPKGDSGPRGQSAKVTCRTVTRKRRTVRCTLKLRGKARLTRKGRVVARGTSSKLKAPKRLARGNFTLRVNGLAVPVRIA